jgi:hypothetical protein
MASEANTLEALALDAHGRGESWAAFWASHGDTVRDACPYDRAAFRRLVSRLLALVVSGDTAGLRTLDSVFGEDPAP